MDFTLQQIFHREIERQCKFALMANEDLKQAVAARQRQSSQPPMETVNHADIEQWQASMARNRQWLEDRKKHQQTRAATHDRLWYSVQAFLIAAANISKLLWPPNSRKGENLLPERGHELRASLEVEEDSPLKPRKLRDYFEHFDVRLEEWAVSSKRLILIDSNIGPMEVISGAEPRDYLRNFDPINFAVTFKEDSYHLLPIVEAIEQLWHKAIVQLQQRASVGGQV